MISRKLLIVKVLSIILFSMIFSKGEISGVSYFDYTYDFTEDAINDEGFSLTRVYLAYKNDISDDVSFKFQSDIDYNNSPVNLYLKKAQLDWKSPVGKIMLGMQGMNMFDVTEKTWGFRFIEKSPMDKHKFSSSADMGIGYSGKFDNLSYNALVTNGSGYKKQENDAYKKMSFQLVYGEKKLVKKDGFNIGTSVSIEPYTGSDNSEENKIVMSFFGGYAGNGLRLGGEFDMHTDSFENQTEQIAAFYASYKVMDNLEGLLYVDMYDPNIDVTKDSETYLITGINYYPTKGLIITPNIRMTSFEDGSDSETMFKMNFRFKF